MNNLDVLEINYKNVKNDFINHKVDLYVAKIELETIITKLMRIHKEQNEYGVLELKVIELLHNARKLLEQVEHEINLQEKEEHLKSMSTEL